MNPYWRKALLWGVAPDDFAWFPTLGLFSAGFGFLGWRFFTFADSQILTLIAGVALSFMFGLIVGMVVGGILEHFDMLDSLWSPLADSIPGFWRALAFRRITKLSVSDDLEAVRTLLEFLTSSVSGVGVRRRRKIKETLKQVTAPACLDLICEMWMRHRDPLLADLIVQKGHVPAAPGFAKVASAVLLRRCELLSNADSRMVEALVQSCGDKDLSIAENARDVLRVLRNPETVDAVRSLWMDGRNPLLAEANGARMTPNRLTRYQRWLFSQKSLIRQWQQKHAVRALIRDKSPEAQDLLCRAVIEYDHPLARVATLENGLAPSDARQRALFFFLTEQWQKYESLDFDHSLLRATYEMSDQGLRTKIMEQARRAGRVEWIEVVSVVRQNRRLGEMTDAEWQTSLGVLRSGRQWEMVWCLAQRAPPRWGKELLQLLSEVAWQPKSEGERKHLAESITLAAAWDGNAPTLDCSPQCLATLNGHESPVRCAAISPDGWLLATGSGSIEDKQDASVRLWSLPEGRAIIELPIEDFAMNGLRFTPDGRTLVTGGGKGVRLWAVPEGKPLADDVPASEAEQLTISPDGQLLVIADNFTQKRVVVWNLPERRQLAVLEHPEDVRCLCVSGNGRFLATGTGSTLSSESRDNAVRVWSLPDLRPQAILRGHTSGLRSIAMSSDARLLASAAEDGTVRVWNMPEEHALATLKVHASSSVAISPNGHLLASGSGWGSVGLWNLSDGTPLAELEGPKRALMEQLTISPDGRLLASAGATHDSGDDTLEDCTIALWRLPDGEKLASLSGHTGWVHCLAMSRDSRLLASGSGDKTVRLWASEFFGLERLPVVQASFRNFDRVEQVLRSGNLPSQDRALCEFLGSLYRGRFRHEIHLVETPVRIEVGQFDIELEGVQA